jgi:hypothetical protein
MNKRFAAALLACCLSPAPVCLAQTIVAPFDSDYTVDLLGSVPGVPTNYGGLTFAKDDPDTILIGGSANQAGGVLYSIGVTRDQDNHITGFTGAASRFAEAPYNDGGVTFGPGGVLFLARWPVNELGQIKPGSATADKVVSMTPFGVPSSLSALAFVPAGFPGAGRFKLVTYASGDWYDAGLVADGNGTFDLVDITHPVQIVGAPEGFVYVPPGSPQFTDYSSMLVAEYGQGKITTYLVDDDGDPITTTRAEFMTGLTGAEGAVVDPLTGDFLFSTFGGSNQVVAVRGFGRPDACHGSDENCAGLEDACHTAFCSPQTDTCQLVTLDDGTACSSGGQCTSGGQCLDGQCVAESSCPTAPGCSDTCDQQSGECRTCGHPFRNDGCVVNAVFVLQGALELRTCELCTCDVDSSATVTTSDALLILRGCAGLPADLECSLPTTTTTTTILP